MLDKHAEENIKLIEILTHKIWGNNCEMGQIKVLNSPYSEFKYPIRLYNKIDVILTYDRSILGIAVRTEKGDVWIDDLTNQIVYDGFESSKPENLDHNFQVLDKVVRKMIGEGKD
jgi:hypothetical protein